MAINQGTENTTNVNNDSNKDVSGDGLPNMTKIYEKDLTVGVEIIAEDKLTLMELLRGIKDVCGNVTGCRFKLPGKYEVTMNYVNGKVMDGFKIKNCMDHV